MRTQAESEMVDEGNGGDAQGRLVNQRAPSRCMCQNLSQKLQTLLKPTLAGIELNDLLRINAMAAG